MTALSRWTGMLCILGATIAQADELVWVEPGPVESSVLYADGSVIELQTETVTTPICGSDTTGVTLEHLREWAALARDTFAPGQPTWQVSDNGPRGGLNIVFNVSGGLPAGAQQALDEVALYIEGEFTDPITVTINFSMFDFGNPGVIGSTNSSIFGSPSWNTCRTGLINGMDADDTIQNSLPAGSTIPVRYDASTATITNEDRAFISRANYNATIGSSAGAAATIQANTGFAFDYDPSNGVPGNTMCFRSVMVHEVAHALGFRSAVDFRNFDIELLDIYRFQRTDGTGTDWNPDDLAEFQTTARTADFNNLNDDANSDIIIAEYRMSDGSPYQASHFREQVANIGIMDPALDFGQTFYPNYYRTSDLNILDAIGWDHVTCAVATFDRQPLSQTITQGQPVTFFVIASGTEPLNYQWRKGGVNLADGPAAGGGTISGATTATLTINPVGALDQGTYDCVVTNGCGTSPSASATLTVCIPVTINDHPDSQEIAEGDPVSFTVQATGSAELGYRWRRGGTALADGPAPGGGTISGVSTPTLTISAVGAADEGNYTCIVSNSCGEQTSDPATLSVGVGVPPATVTGATSRKNCDLAISSFNGGSPVASESRQGGVTELRIAFDLPPAGPGPSPVTIEQATCAAPAYVPYSGSSSASASLAANELVVTFTPGLENARTYRIAIGADVTSIAGQFVEVRGLTGDVNSDGGVNGTDRSVVVSAWTGPGVTCATDLNGDGATNSTDRSVVVSAWTGSANCAP